MCRVGLFGHFSAASMLALAGCESHEAKIDALQKEYDKIGQSISARTVPLNISRFRRTSARSAQTRTQKVKQAWDQLNAERSKK